MPIRAKTIALGQQAAKALDSLAAASKSDAEARSIVRRIRALKPILLNDALHGEVVKKPLPPQLVARHGVENLYAEDLPAFWRLLYTIVRVDMQPHIVIVEIVTHKTYDKWF